MNTRSKVIVSKLKDLGIGVSYQKVMNIENCLANSIIKEAALYDGLSPTLDNK